MIIRLNDHHWVVADLISALCVTDDRVVVHFRDGSSTWFRGAVKDVERIAAEINAAGGAK